MTHELFFTGGMVICAAVILLFIFGCSRAWW